MHSKYIMQVCFDCCFSSVLNKGVDMLSGPGLQDIPADSMAALCMHCGGSVGHLRRAMAKGPADAGQTQGTTVKFCASADIPLNKHERPLHSLLRLLVDSPGARLTPSQAPATGALPWPSYCVFVEHHRRSPQDIIPYRRNWFARQNRLQSNDISRRVIYFARRVIFGVPPLLLD